MNTSRALQTRATASIPLFLAPAFAETSVASQCAARSFSSTTHNLSQKKGKDKNKNRGVSAIRSTGPRHLLPVNSLFKELPKPVPDNERPLDEFPTNPNHGLYGFFTKTKDTVLPGEREEDHGREWTYHELLFKKFEDLHTIYWQAALEKNRIETRTTEHFRLKLGYGRAEAQERRTTVDKTQRAIKQVLLDRQLAHEEATLLREQKTIKELLETEPVNTFDDPDMAVDVAENSQLLPNVPPSDSEPSLSRTAGRQVLGPRPKD